MEDDWLVAEWLAADASGAADDALIANGVSSVWLGAGALLGAHRYRTTRITTFGRNFQPDEGGQPAIIVPAIPQPIADLGEWEPADLIAFRLENPDRWFRRAEAIPFLNFEAIEAAEHFGTPLPIHSSPLAWLRARGAGTVVLDDDVDLKFWLGGVKTIDADTLRLGEAIEKRLRTIVRLPLIRVPRGATK